MDVLSVGIFVVDVSGKPVRRMPEPGELEFVDHLEIHMGGCAGNTAIGLARLGLQAGVAGRVGADILGDFILDYLQRNGLDISGMRIDPATSSSFSFVMIHQSGERAFFHHMGTNAEFGEDDIDFAVVRSSRILHVGGTLLMPKFDGEPTARVLRRAKEAGVTTSLDTVRVTDVDAAALLEPALPYIDVFLPSFDEAVIISGRKDLESIAAFFLERGVGTVAIKMGSDGCCVAREAVHLRVPAFQVEAVDTTGAGDAFAAGFLAGLALDWDIERTARLACAVGACCVQSVGCTTGIRSMDETQEFIRTTAVRPLER